MKKKDRTPGLDYMIELGFKPEKSFSKIKDRVYETTDKDVAERIMKAIDSRGDGKGNNDSFYKQKNSTLKLSLAITGAFDADILKRACNWIVEHKDFFNKTILEVGCDCGVMSCFLARMFPDSHITSIDRCEEAISNAKELAAKLSISNITFLTCDLKDLSGTYDTVFSMRTVHENFEAPEEAVNDLSEQAEVFRDSLAEYANALRSRLSEDGVLISIERIGRNALLLGWMEALYDAGLFFLTEVYDELKCLEVGQEAIFQAFVSVNKDIVLDPISARELFDYACSKYLDYSEAEYHDWDAKIVYENRRGALIEGYLIEYHKPVSCKSKIAAWTHATDPTGLLVYLITGDGKAQLQFFDISNKEEVLQGVRNSIEESKQFDPTVTITKLSI